VRMPLPFDQRTFSGLVPVLLAWPWIDYFPSALFLVMVFFLFRIGKKTPA
jgi:hypothetical protein